MAIATKRFDIANYLKDEASIQEYFRQVLADGDSDEIVRALGHIARVRGMAKLAADMGLGRESLYKTFAEGSHPRFDTILRVSRALGVPLTVG